MKNSIWIFVYVKRNWIVFAVATYMLFSCVLKILTGINITIPCIFKTLFNFKCPGCGLTSAFIDLLKGNISHAWDHNPLIFVVIPVGLFYIVADIIKFKNRYKLKPGIN